MVRAPQLKPGQPDPNQRQQQATQATQPQAGGQRSTNDMQGLQQEWAQFFRRPEVVSSLLQFGAAALTPGVSLGEAIGQGAAAGGRTHLLQQEQQAQQQTQQLQERQVAAEERRAATGERRAATAEKTAERQAQLSEQELALERQKLEKYYIPSLNKPASGKTPAERMFADFFDAYIVSAQLGMVPEEDREAAEQRPALYAAQKAREDMTRFLGQQLPTPGEEQTVPGQQQAPGQQPQQQAPAPQSLDVAPSGQALPDPTTLSDEQWLAIEADPQAKQEAVQVWGEQLVNTQILVAKQKKSPGGVPGIIQRGEGAREFMEGQR